LETTYLGFSCVELRVSYLESKTAIVYNFIFGFFTSAFLRLSSFDN